MLSHVALFALGIALSSAVDIVEDCGPSDAYIKFHKIDIDPMPFNILGKVNVEADVETRNVVGNKVRMSVTLKKKNLGAAFTWQIPCTNIGAIGEDYEGYIGTCDYKGSCDFPFIQSWIQDNSCPAFFKDYDIPCKCPFPAQRFTTKGRVSVDLGQFEDRMPSWLIEGGYDVEARLFDTTRNDKLVGCLRMKFDINAKKPCPEVLKKLNACP